jgi:FkbM family methyltransferase
VDYDAFAADHARATRGQDRKELSQRVERAFLELCRDLRPTLSLELGAHEATFSSWIKREVPTARCLAFEANPFVHEKYAAALAEAGVDYRAQAIAAENGTVELTIPTYVFKKARKITNRMASLGQHRDAKDATVVEVESVRLDDQVDVGPHDVVVAWVDVEGASEIVLTSSRDVLARASIVYIEVEKEEVWAGQWLDIDVAAFFVGLGFVPLMRDRARPHQYNVVYARPEIAGDPKVSARVAAAYRA